MGTTGPNCVLMVAFHFPPQAGSSGIQRTLRFVQELPSLGWNPVVLTAHPRAYESVGADLVDEIPSGVRVIRAPAWDTARHFAIAGRYPGFLARPDRWLSWLPGAVAAGLVAIRRHRPSALWSTFPIATTHLIAGILARLTNTPWIADFRDPMSQANYPPDPLVRKRLARLERITIARARWSTFTTPGTLATYQTRYAEQRRKLELIENGYDERSFNLARRADPLRPGKLTLLHSGIVYPSERDPTCLMQAFARLQAMAPEKFHNLHLRFRAPADDGLVLNLARRYGVEDSVECLPAIGYRDALCEMMDADGLLILQAANCSTQIPAKYYEYIRTGRPMLALTDPGGDTGQSMKRAGLDTIAPLDDVGAIADLLGRFVVDHARLPRPDPGIVAQASRAGRARQLADLLDAL